MQPYLLSAINGFVYRDHRVEPVAKGDLIVKMRKSMAASHVEKEPPGVRTHAPGNSMIKVLDLVERLREELDSSWEPNQHPRIALFRTAIAVLGMYMLYARGKAGVQCAMGDFVGAPDGSLLV